MEEILDKPELPVASQLNWKNYFPLGLLWVGMCLSLLIGTGMQTKFLAGSVFLIISTVFSGFHWRWGVWAQGITMVLGTIYLIRLLPAAFHFGFELGSTFVGIEMVMLLVLYLFYRMTWLPLYPRKAKVHTEETDTVADEPDPKEPNSGKIAGFKHRFRHKSVPELQIISENERLVLEARLAAKALLAEKDPTGDGG